MTDAELILLLTKAIAADPEKPILDQQFNPTDPIAVALVLYEVDFAVETYMEKFKSYRDKFKDPAVYDNFVLTYQQKARKDVRRLIAEAQQVIAEVLEEGDEDMDDEGYEG